MNRIRSALATATVAVMAACAPMPRGGSVQAPLGEPFRLAQGETASVTGTQMTVRFAEVVSDSRCPVGVQCVRAGDVCRGAFARLKPGCGYSMRRSTASNTSRPRPPERPFTSSRTVSRLSPPPRPVNSGRSLAGSTSVRQSPR